MPIYPNPRDDTSILILVADSLRYDTAVTAKTPFLSKFGVFRKAFAQATFTWPAHLAMMVGMLPHCFENAPFYNRYIRQLLRLGSTRGTGGGDRQGAPGFLIDSPLDLPRGFKQRGFITAATGAVTWMTHPYWSIAFDEFEFMFGAEVQVPWFLSKIDSGKPFFGLINFGETHEPYSFGTVRVPMPRGYQQHKLGSGPLSDDDFKSLHDRQRRALEYIDAEIRQLYHGVSQPTIFIFTSDHGECFGEDGYFGHGFYHPKVMEVPMLIFSNF